MKRIAILLLTVCLLWAGTVAAEDALLRIYQQGNESFGGTEQELESLLKDGPGRYGVAQVRFAAQYPGMTIEHRWLNTQSLGGDEVFAAIQAVADEADILFLWHPDLPALAAAGLAEDLSDSTAIKEAVGDWDWLPSLLGEDGRLYAIPETVTPHLVRVCSPALLEALSASIDGDSWTWDDLFDLGDALARYGEANGETVYLAVSRTFNPLWLEQWLWNEHYGNDGGAPDLDVLRSLLPRWKDLLDRGLIITPAEYAEAREALSTQTLLEIGPLGFYQIEEANTYLPPRYGDAARTVAVDAFVYAVNPASPNAQAAMDFLAYYCAPDALSASMRYWENGLFPEETDSAAWPFGAPGVRERSATTPGLYELWSQALASSFLLHAADTPAAVYDACRAYLDGETDLEACVAQIAAVLGAD